MNFNESAQNHPLLSLSAVTHITEGSLQNNFDDFLGAGDSLDNLPRRQILDSNPLINQAVAERLARHAHADAPCIGQKGH